MITATVKSDLNRALSVDRLRDVLDYDPDTGIFRWRVTLCRRVRAGAIAGTLGSNGYRATHIDGRRHYSHRLAWLYVTGACPRDQIDHINGIRDDNRFCNLREVDNSANGQNRARADRDSATGLLGVSPHRSRFRAQIRLNGRQRYLGTYTTAEEAHKAYVGAKLRIHAGAVPDRLCE